nr:HU family DNA-binding protein [uncultured Prevotella sp.]
MIKINDLIQDAAKKQGLSKAELEKFVSLMVDVLNEGLQADRLVKVKGLGTFKVASVSARESINVNTGDRITIEGRDKISFTPEATLRDFVNSPFAQFETVTINEGVNLDALISSEAENVPTEDLQDVANMADAQETAAIVKQEDNFETENKGEVSDEIIEEENLLCKLPKELKTFGADECMIVEDLNEGNDINMPVLAEDPELDETLPVTDSVNVTQKQSIESKPPIQNEMHTSSSQRSLRHMIALLSVLCLVLLCICVGEFYYMFTQIDERNQRIDDLMTKIIDSKKAPHAVKSQPIKYESVKPLVEKTSVVTGEQKEKNKDVQDPKVQTLKQKTFMTKSVDHQLDRKPQKNDIEENDFSALNNRDVRVRTGAYRIVGVHTTVIVKKGQTLASLSRLYLGPEMECYVEVLNDRKTVKAGELLKIPALKLKKSR